MGKGQIKAHQSVSKTSIDVSLWNILHLVRFFSFRNARTGALICDCFSFLIEDEQFFFMLETSDSFFLLDNR